MEQQPVPKILIEVQRERAAAQVHERAVPLVTMCRDAPSGLADSERQIGFVPAGRYEGLVERSHPIEAGATDHPWSNHGIDLLEPEPVEEARSNRAFEPAEIDQPSHVVIGSSM
jgi:hypothetical protein